MIISWDRARLLREDSQILICADIGNETLEKNVAAPFKCYSINRYDKLEGNIISILSYNNRFS